MLEAFGPAHRNGSSHGSARIFRRAYPDPLYVRLTGQSEKRWRALEAEAGEDLLTLTGGIDFGAAREPERLHAVLTECGVPAELLPEQAAAERWPFIDFRGVGQVMYHADAGVSTPTARSRRCSGWPPPAAPTSASTPRSKGWRQPRRRRRRQHRERDVRSPGRRRRGRPVDRPAARRPGRAAAADRHPAAGLPLRPGARTRSRAVAGLHPLRRRRLPLRPARRPRRRGARRGQDRRARSRPGHHRRRPRLPRRPGRQGSGCARSSPTGCPASTPPRSTRRAASTPGPRTRTSSSTARAAGRSWSRPPCSGHGAKFAPLIGEIIADLAAGAPAPGPALHPRRAPGPKRLNAKTPRTPKR